MPTLRFESRQNRAFDDPTGFNAKAAPSDSEPAVVPSCLHILRAAGRAAPGPTGIGPLAPPRLAPFPERIAAA